MSLSLLRSALERNIPPIVLLKTGFLGYWSENVSHACLLAGMTETAVFLHHPWLASGPVEVTRTEFIAAGTEMDYLAAIVAPARQFSGRDGRYHETGAASDLMNAMETYEAFIDMAETAPAYGVTLTTLDEYIRETFVQ